MIETNFKHTDIGPIPHDWEVKRLGDIMDIKSGDSITGDSFLINGKFPVYGGNGIRGHVNQWNICGRYILIGRVGALCGNIHITSGKAFASEHALVCHPNCKYNADFLSPILRGMNLGQYSGASAQPVLAAGKLSKLQICFPPVEEQEAIGKALSDVDGLIEGLRKLIEKKRNIKQGAMSRLLSGSLRLPGFNKSWENFRIGDLSSVQAGATPSTEKSEYWNGDIRWMNSGEINLKYVREVQNRITQKGYDSTSTHMLPLHCVLLGLAGQGKTRGTAAINLVELCTNQSIAAIYPSDCFDSFFLYHLLDSKYSDLRMLSSGEGTRGGLTKRQIENIELLMPTDLAEQSAIAKVLTDMDAEIEGLEKKLAKYGQVKQGMMKQLLTGKIRLI